MRHHRKAGRLNDTCRSMLDLGNLGMRIGVGIDMREGVVEVAGEVVAQGGGGLVGFVGGAGFVVEVARALDIAVLQVVGPGADLAGAAFGERFQI